LDCCLLVGWNIWLRSLCPSKDWRMMGPQWPKELRDVQADAQWRVKKTYSRAPERYQIDGEWREELVQLWKRRKLQSAGKLRSDSRTHLWRKIVVTFESLRVWINARIFGLLCCTGAGAWMEMMILWFHFKVSSVIHKVDGRRDRAQYLLFYFVKTPRASRKMVLPLLKLMSVVQEC